MKAIKFKGRSNKFGNKVLVWEKQRDLVMDTARPTFSWQIQNGPIKNFTIQSLVQAFFKGNFTLCHTKKDNEIFYTVSYKYLVEVK